MIHIIGQVCPPPVPSGILILPDTIGQIAKATHHEGGRFGLDGLTAETRNLAGQPNRIALGKSQAFGLSFAEIMSKASR